MGDGELYRQKVKCVISEGRAALELSIGISAYLSISGVK